MDEWTRVERIAVFDAPHRVRYPSIAESGDGALLVLFTRQLGDQQSLEGGDLVLSRSADGGRTWAQPRVVYGGQTGEPRALGTLTRLKGGRLVAPFAELSGRQTQSTVRLLVSQDNGETWQAHAVSATTPLVWWVPCGRIVESADGMLTMPVFGAATEDDLRATIHGCGLLRSHDGGATWHDYRSIAGGPGSVIGAVPETRFSFEGPVVQPIQDGRWLAMITVRRLNRSGTGSTAVDEGPGAPHVLCRLWSTDEGRTWTEPDQLAPGAWPALSAAGDFTLCTSTLWSAWGDMRLIVSCDGFTSFQQEVRMTDRGWLRGMLNRPQEVPLPPTVPYLADDWPFEHYGFPSSLALDNQRLVVVFGRPQRGEGQIEGPENQRIPYEQERIQAVFYRRTPIAGRQPRTSSVRADCDSSGAPSARSHNNVLIAR